MRPMHLIPHVICTEYVAIVTLLGGAKFSFLNGLCEYMTQQTGNLLVIHWDACKKERRDK